MNYKVVKVELKPLDIASYCKSIFEKGSKTLIMSATILNNKAFCKSIGLNPPRKCKDYISSSYIRFSSREQRPSILLILHILTIAIYNLLK